MGRTTDIAAQREAAKAEAAALLRKIAAPMWPDEPVHERIERAAALLKWPYGRTENIWRRQALRIDVWEMDQLRKWRPP